MLDIYTPIDAITVTGHGPLLPVETCHLVPLDIPKWAVRARPFRYSSSFLNCSLPRKLPLNIIADSSVENLT